jgi:predicted alpha-1,2-mannosidase
MHRRTAATFVSCAVAASLLTGTVRYDAAATSTISRTAEVNLFVGTLAGQPDFGTGGGAGNTYPGAQAPFGMLAWSPDTYPSAVNFAGGYTYSDTQLKGFSLTHLSGPGCAVFGDVPILPISVPMGPSPAKVASSALDATYATTFTHDGEWATPGHYNVTLNPDTPRAIRTSLTADTRSGLGRFRFSATPDAGFLINAGGSAMAASAADVQIDPAKRLVTGSVTSGRFCFSNSSYRLYFAIRFSRDLTSHGTWQKQVYTPDSTEASDVGVLPANYTPIPGGPGQFPGDPSGTAQTGAYVGFDARERRDVTMKVGISYVDPAGALRNLDAEQPSWDLRAAREQVWSRWDDALGRIDVDGGSAARRRVFYTALYRSLQSPSVFSDVDGRYIGMDGAIRRTRRTHYANFSGWDVYRTQLPLVAMLFPHRASDIAQSLVDQAEQAGWLPKWSYANANTGVMTGDPALPSLASMYALGARDFDVRAAVRLGEKGATDPSQLLDGQYVVRPGVIEYNELGYVPAEDDGHNPVAAIVVPGTVWGSAATTLEYAVADYSLSRLARRVGNDAVVRSALGRSASWGNLYNPASGFIEPRSTTGLFEPGYDVAGGDGFVEGSAAQYTWFVPHDVAGLIDAMGGREVARQRLDEFFTELNAGPTSRYAFLGNEPSLGTPWLYAWLGEPNAIQDIIRRTTAGLYKDNPGGLPGNDDLGTMSAWYVLAALGLYPAIPGDDALILTTPQFAGVRIHLPGGTIRLRVDGDPATAPYIRGLTVDGQKWMRPWIRFAGLRNGATLVFSTSKSPDTGWGTRPQDAPPSATKPTTRPGPRR